VSRTTLMIARLYQGGAIRCRPRWIDAASRPSPLLRKWRRRTGSKVASPRSAGTWAQFNHHAAWPRRGPRGWLLPTLLPSRWTTADARGQAWNIGPARPLLDGSGRSAHAYGSDAPRRKRMLVPGNVRVHRL